PPALSPHAVAAGSGRTRPRGGSVLLQALVVLAPLGLTAVVDGPPVLLVPVVGGAPVGLVGPVAPVPDRRAPLVEEVPDLAAHLFVHVGAEQVGHALALVGLLVGGPLDAVADLIGE